MKTEGQSQVSVKWAAVILGIVAVVIGVSIAMLSLKPTKKIDNFDGCIKAGGARLESYPEQCLYDGKTYMNEMQRPPRETGFVGMTEDDALLTAAENRIPARVVERDDEALPVTMDFVRGRHNLYVKDNLVYKVEIEGNTTGA